MFKKLKPCEHFLQMLKPNTQRKAQKSYKCILKMFPFGIFMWILNFHGQCQNRGTLMNTTVEKRLDTSTEAKGLKLLLTYHAHYPVNMYSTIVHTLLYCM